ncbi:MAG: hypothetical protein ACRBDL_08860 [Alphaproteobacteria bacterium]
MSRHELNAFQDEYSIHVGWDNEHGMYYLEAQVNEMPGEYVLEADVDQISMQAERYAEIEESLKEQLLQDELDSLREHGYGQVMPDDLDLGAYAIEAGIDDLEHESVWLETSEYDFGEDMDLEDEMEI